MKSLKVLAVLLTSVIVMSFSYAGNTVQTSQSCEEEVIVIYERYSDCGGYEALFYIKNGDGICGNNYFTLPISDGCDELVPDPGHPY